MEAARAQVRGVFALLAGTLTLTVIFGHAIGLMTFSRSRKHLAQLPQFGG